MAQMTGLGDTGRTAVRRAVRYGWVPLIALAGTTALESGERQSLSQAVVGIQHQFHVSDSTMGFLPFAMAIVGALGAIPLGILADRTRRTVLLTVAMLVWTACMGLNGLAASFGLLFVFRMGVGTVEANGPAAVSLLSDYYPVGQRAKMMGLYQSGALAGAIIGLIGGGVAVSLGGWRWAFLMWIPIGLASSVLMLAQPEPRRGDQDAEFGHGGDDAPDQDMMVNALADLLPQPMRIGTLDYSTCSARDVGRELLRIPSMWFGVLAITISQLLLAGLQFWGVTYYKRVFHLGPAAAGGLTALLGLGSVVGILGGGYLADHHLRKGRVNARVHVIAWASIAATLVLVPAFASTILVLTAPLMFVGGIMLTLPVAPAEALMSDVVVAEMRGRAATVRSIVRALSSVGPLLIGAVSAGLVSSGLSSADGLRWAIVSVAPLYALGGFIMLFALRTYPTDLAFVMAESRRTRAVTDADEGDGTPG